MFALYGSITGISTDKSTSLCCSVKRESKYGGQGFVKLIVMELKDAKQTNVNICFKPNVQCNSRCHTGLCCGGGTKMLANNFMLTYV